MRLPVQYIKSFRDCTKNFRILSERLPHRTVAIADAEKEELFIDKADGKLKFKDATGTTNVLY